MNNRDIHPLFYETRLFFVKKRQAFYIKIIDIISSIA